MMETKQLSLNESEDAFFSLKINKNHGHDNIWFFFFKKSNKINKMTGP